MINAELDKALTKFFNELAELLKTANQFAKAELGAGTGTQKPPRVGSIGVPPDQP